MKNMFGVLHSLTDLDLTLLTTFKKIWLDPANGSDQRDGTTLKTAVATLEQAYALATTGKNDTIMLVSDGASTSTARVDTAFTWAKNATHLVGVTPDLILGQRARIAPNTTTVGASTNKDYVTVTGHGCYFKNIQIWAGFATGIAATVALAVSGTRNLFKNCQIVGHADAVSAADTASASLALKASENQFVDCTIGTDTILRSVLNSSVLFSGGAARSMFTNCHFPIYTSDVTSLLLQVRAASPNGADRETVFDNCSFMNITGITSAVTLAAVCKSVASGINGYFVMKDCVRVGITDWGTDATSLAKIQVCGAGTGGTAADDVGRAAPAVAS